MSMAGIGASEMKALLEGLNSLHDGERALARIILAGPAAVPFLSDFLMHSPPSSVYQPRRWAVEGLGALGAKGALIDYLAAGHEIADPVVRAGEEAVQNAAARELARWLEDDVFELLTALAQRRLTPGLIETLGAFEREESIPVLDRALQDDLARAAAESALRRMGNRASSALALSAITPLPSAVAETASSVLRRISATRLLIEIGAKEEDWPALEQLLGESDPRLVMAAGLLALRMSRSGFAAVGRAILRILPHAPWDVRLEAGDVLAELMPELRSKIEAEIEERRQSPAAAFDPVLPVLLHAVRSASASR
jgi:hypothetical protein